MFPTCLSASLRVLFFKQYTHFYFYVTIFISYFLDFMWILREKIILRKYILFYICKYFRVMYFNYKRILLIYCHCENLRYPRLDMAWAFIGCTFINTCQIKLIFIKIILFCWPSWLTNWKHPIFMSAMPVPKVYL